MASYQSTIAFRTAHDGATDIVSVRDETDKDSDDIPTAAGVDASGMKQRSSLLSAFPAPTRGKSRTSAVPRRMSLLFRDIQRSSSNSALINNAEATWEPESHRNNQQSSNGALSIDVGPAESSPSGGHSNNHLEEAFKWLSEDSPQNSSRLSLNSQASDLPAFHW